MSHICRSYVTIFNFWKIAYVSDVAGRTRPSYTPEQFEILCRSIVKLRQDGVLYFCIILAVFQTRRVYSFSAL